MLATGCVIFTHSPGLNRSERRQRRDRAGLAWFGVRAGQYSRACLLSGRAPLWARFFFVLLVAFCEFSESHRLSSGTVRGRGACSPASPPHPRRPPAKASSCSRAWRPARPGPGSAWCRWRRRYPRRLRPCVEVPPQAPGAGWQGDLGGCRGNYQDADVYSWSSGGVLGRAAEPVFSGKLSASASVISSPREMCASFVPRMGSKPEIGIQTVRTEQVARDLLPLGIYCLTPAMLCGGLAATSGARGNNTG